MNMRFLIKNLLTLALVSAVSHSFAQDVYPNRPDQYDASGWTELCDKRRTDDEIFINDKTPEQKAETKASLDELHKLERQYEPVSYTHLTLPTTSRV